MNRARLKERVKRLERSLRLACPKCKMPLEIEMKHHMTLEIHWYGETSYLLCHACGRKYTYMIEPELREVKDERQNPVRDV